MKENQKRIIPLTMVLQILIVSFTVMAIPVSAEDISLPDLPDQPLTLKGNVELDGVLASVDTVIYAELNGEIATDVIYVVNKGEYIIPVTYSEDYSNLKFYVNEIETKLVDATVFDGASAGDIIESVNLVATSPVTIDNSNNDDSSYRRTATTSDEEDSSSTVSTSTTDGDDTSLRSVAETSQSMGSTEDVPTPETKTSFMVLVIGAIVLLGIVVIVGYKLKEN